MTHKNCVLLTLKVHQIKVLKHEGDSIKKKTIQTYMKIFTITYGAIMARAGPCERSACPNHPSSWRARSVAVET